MLARITTAFQRRRRRWRRWSRRDESLPRGRSVRLWFDNWIEPRRRRRCRDQSSLVLFRLIVVVVADPTMLIYCPNWNASQPRLPCGPVAARGGIIQRYIRASLDGSSRHAILCLYGHARHIRRGRRGFPLPRRRMYPGETLRSFHLNAPVRRKTKKRISRLLANHEVVSWAASKQWQRL